MYFVDLIEFVVTREKRKKTHYFKEYTPHSPKIHFISIVTVCQKTFRSSVPSSRNVFSVRLLRVDSSAGTKISQFNLVFKKKDVFPLNE